MTSNDSSDSDTENKKSKISTTSLHSSFSNVKQSVIAVKVKALEIEIKQKMSRNFNSVRKAWLELDDNHKGLITVEELAKFLGANIKLNFDYSLLEILVKMRTKSLSNSITYNDFCTWLGGSVEPTEAFYFRHDSNKNP